MPTNKTPHALVLQNDTFGNEDIFATLKNLGIKTTPLIYEDIFLHQDERFDAIFAEIVEKKEIDFVFSLNYYPILSHNCQKYNIKYISLVYDCPHIALYTYTITFDCNYIFIFDYAMYEELKKGGINTVYYTPLPANIERLNALLGPLCFPNNYENDISFVGSLYNETHNLYDRLYEKLMLISPYTCGTLDALIDAQSHLYGSFILEKGITDDMLSKMIEAYPYTPGKDTIATPRYVYAHYFLARKATELERARIIKKIAKEHQLTLYTHNSNANFDNVINKGSIDYLAKMPKVFRKSKINLNITLKSIKTGIPLRCIDIMASGGFLLTNYQEDLFRHFEPDTEFVYYSDDDDLCSKIDYYLSHPKEREEIAMNGYTAINEFLTHDNILKLMLETAEILY